MPENDLAKVLAIWDCKAGEVDALRRRKKARVQHEQELPSITILSCSASASAVELHASPLASAHALNLLPETQNGIRDRLEVVNRAQTEQVCSSELPMGLDW